MKIPRFSPVLCLVVNVCLPAWLAAAETKVAETKAAPAPGTHVLFMGADLSVQRDKKIYKVDDIAGSDFKIHVGREEVLVPTRQGPVNLQINAGLKLAAISVQLDKLESGPAYTYANDPMRKLQETANTQMDIAAAQDMANTQMAIASSNLSAAQNVVNSGTSRNPEAAQRDLDNARGNSDRMARQVASLDNAMNSNLANMGAGAHGMQLAEGNYDAMEVSFKISSPVVLDQPYMVVLFKFHPPDAKPGVEGLVIHAQALDTIDDNPRYVRVVKGGLPPGFKFVDCAVHIYNHGAEVATNHSAKRVEMSRDETQQYIVMEYLGDHKGRTAPAAAVRGSLPRALRQRLAPDQLNRVFFAKISKDGALLGAYADENCGLKLEDAATLAAVGEVFFTPELQQGKPVDGIVRMKLADI